MSQDITLHQNRNFPVGPEELWGQQPSTQLGAYQPQNGQAQPLKKLNRLLRGRWLLAISLSIAGAVGGALAGWKSSVPLYAGMGTVEAKPFIANLSLVDKVMPYFDKFLKNQTFVITDGRTISQALARPEWTRVHGHKPTPEYVAAFQNNLTANLVKDSAIIQIAFTNEDPKMAAAGCTAIMKAYEALANDQVAMDQKKKLDTAQQLREKAYNDQKRNEDLVADLSKDFGAPDMTAVLLKKQEYKTTLEIDLQQNTFMRELVEASLPSSDPKKATPKKHYPAELWASIDDRAKELLKVLNEKTDKVNQLRIGGMLDAHPAMQRAMAEMTAASEQLKARVNELENTSVVMPNLNNNGNSAIGGMPLTQASVDFLKQKEKQLTAALAKQDEDIKKMGATQRDIVKYQNEAKRSKEMVDQYDKQIEQFLANASIQGTIALGGEPVIPLQPAIDKRKQFALMGLVVGGGVPFGLMLLIGLLDSRYRYSDDTSEAGVHGLTLLGILPNLPDRLSDPGQASIAAHCVHQIRTMLQINSAMMTDRRAYSVTSASSGDGKTSLTLALGLSFAASGSRTLLIDSDLVGAGLTARLGMNGPEGILEAMTSGNLLEYVKQTDVSDLAILPVGLAQLHHAGIFSPQAVRRLVNEAKKHYEIILIDTGPILGSIEATPVAAASDGVILTVARGQQRPLVEKALAHLNSIGARVAGVVFNRAQSRDFEQSISGISMRSASRSANGNGASRAGQAKDAGQYGPVARAVATTTAKSGDGTNKN
jgi:capsular exopolysaccharide synthesis family protein